MQKLADEEEAREMLVEAGAIEVRPLSTKHVSLRLFSNKLVFPSYDL
jgi:hypothetical protein